MSTGQFTVLAAWLDGLKARAHLRTVSINAEQVTAVEFRIPSDNMLAAADHFRAMAKLLEEAHWRRLSPAAPDTALYRKLLPQEEAEA